MYGYFDESGKFQRSDFFCMAGLVADDSRWTTFSEEWDRLLKTYSLRCMKMRDAASSIPKGVFSGWPLEKVNKVVGEFVDVIRRNVVLGFGIAMDTEYLRTTPKEFQRRIGDAHYFCFQRMMRLVVEKLAEIKYDGPIPINFDDTEEHAVLCYRLWSKLRKLHPELRKSIAAVTFADDQVFLPLQAADLLAQQTRDNLTLLQKREPQNEHFVRLVTPIRLPDVGIHYASEMWNKEGLDDLRGQFERGEIVRIS